MEEIKNNNDNKGLVVAELVKRTRKQTKKGETFYILEISICRTITETVLKLRGEEHLISTNSKDPLFVFTNEGRNKYAYTMEIGFIYAFWFIKRHSSESKEDYFHVKDWKKLSADKRSIERTLRLILNKKEEEEEEEEDMTNQELLTEVKKRIKEGKISFKLSAVNSNDIPLEVDADLKDNESNFRFSLQENNEEIA